MSQAFKKVLVANRGEIAMRIFRACHDLGLQTVAIYSNEDVYSLFRTAADESYLIGENESPLGAYLDIPRIIELAKKHGADLINLDDIQIHPCGTPGTGLMENIRTSGRNRIFVNLEGDRFVNEGAARDVLAGAIFAQPKSTYYVVVNKVRYPSRDWVDANGATIRDMVALGSVVEANTLEELAKKTGMDPAKLKASVDNYNKIVKGEMKDPLGFKADNKADTTLTEGPWYACKKVPTVHHTMGGIKINVNAQVIDVNGKVIPGLYAAGEVTGGIHGSNRLGGNAIADVMTFGRTAGTNVVKMK